MSNATTLAAHTTIAEARPRQPASMRWALAALSLSVLMPSLDTSIANAGLPVLAEAFHASFAHTQWIVLAYLLAMTTLVVGAGRLGDVIGRRKLFIAGIGLFTGASLMCGIAPTLWLLLVARATQGLGAAIMVALSVALAGDTVPKPYIGRVTGLLGTMSAAGTALGPSLGGLLMATLGWEAIFLINVPLGLVAMAVARRHVAADPPARRAERAAFDTTGAVVLVLTLAAYALAMTMGESRFGWVNASLLATTIVGVVVFVRLERRSPAPLIQLELLRDRGLASGMAMSVLVSTVMMTTLIVGPFYLTRTLALDTTSAGFILSIGPLVAALTGVPAGRVVDRHGTERVTLAGLVGLTAGASLLPVMPSGFGVVGYVAPLGMMTSSYAIFQAANNTAMIALAPPEQRGVVSGMLSLSRYLGLLTGASVMGAVFAAASTSALSPHSVATGMRATYAVAAALTAAALALGIRSSTLVTRHSR